MAKTTVYRPQMASFNPQAQAGVALIAVLLFLILITIAGVIAVRQSSVDLRVATADQANALMMNASDSVLADIEQTSTPGHANYERMLSEGDGIMGYFAVQSTEKIGDQLHFCYRPANEHLFSLSEARILKNGGGYQGNTSTAICDGSKSADYVSSRNTTLTQVAIRALDAETASPFSVNTTGETSGVSSTSQVPSLSIHSATVLPALSKAENSDLSTCLGYPVGDDVEDTYSSDGANGNMSSCLRTAGIPSTVLVEDALLKVKVSGGLDSSDSSDTSSCENDAECNAALTATD